MSLHRRECLYIGTLSDTECKVIQPGQQAVTAKGAWREGRVVALLPAESQQSPPGWLCEEPPARWLLVEWYVQQGGYVYKWCHGLGDHSRYRSTCASKYCTVSTPVHNPAVHIAPVRVQLCTPGLLKLQPMWCSLWLPPTCKT